MWSIAHLGLFLVLMGWFLLATDQLIKGAADDEQVSVAPVMVPFAGSMLLGVLNVVLVGAAIVQGRLAPGLGLGLEHRGSTGDGTQQRQVSPLQAQEEAAQLLGLPPRLVQGIQVVLAVVVVGLFLRLQVTAFL